MGLPELVKEWVDEPERSVVLREGYLVRQGNSAGEKRCRRARPAAGLPSNELTSTRTVGRNRVAGVSFERDVRDETATTGESETLLVPRSRESPALTAATSQTNAQGEVVPGFLILDGIIGIEPKQSASCACYERRRRRVLDRQLSQRTIPEA